MRRFNWVTDKMSKNHKKKKTRKSRCSLAYSGLLRVARPVVLLVTAWGPPSLLTSSDTGHRGFTPREDTSSDERQAEGQAERGPKDSEEPGQGGKTQVSLPLVSYLCVIQDLGGNF